jgi:hypothetical protein
MLPPEREVDCACAIPLQRPVGFDPTGATRHVTACVRCGVVTFLEVMIHEPHPNDTISVGNQPIILEPRVLAWLASWPRLAGQDSDWKNLVFLSASVRARNKSTLAAIEAEECAAQASLSLKQRWLRAGVPDEPVPASSELDTHLRRFVEVWEGLRLTESTPYEELLTHVRTGGYPFALELLRRRPSFEADVAELLCSSDVKRRQVGADLAGKLELATPAILASLEKWFDEGAPDTNLYIAFDTVSRLGQKAKKLAIPLDRLAARIGTSDYFLRERALNLAARLRRPNPSPEPGRDRKKRHH